MQLLLLQIQIWKVLFVLMRELYNIIQYVQLNFDEFSCKLFFFKDLYGVRNDLGNLLKALGYLEEAKVNIQK
jgi:hypothetical protein